MKSRFFKTELPRPRNLLRLLALGFVAFAAPAYATTVPADFACTSHKHANSCSDGKHQLRGKSNRFAADAPTFEFHKSGPNAPARQQTHSEDRGNLLRNITPLFFGHQDGGNFGKGRREPEVGFNMDFGQHADLLAGKRRDHRRRDDFENKSEKFGGASGFEPLRSALVRGELRPGKHGLAAFEGCFDDSLLNQPSTVVPIPATVWLFATGLIGFVGIARRRAEESAPTNIK